MSELIVRLSSFQNNSDVEVLVNDIVEDRVLEKKISLIEFAKIICKNLDNELDTPFKPIYLDKSIIGINRIGGKQIYLINQPLHQRFVTYSLGKDSRAMKINFPNSIYLVSVENEEVSEIKAYMYDAWNDKYTKLYKYAMPNMLGQNKICIGQANRKIENNDIIKTLENIIYAPYSHRNVNDVKSFKDTQDYFEYLSKNRLDKKYLFEANIQIKDLVA